MLTITFAALEIVLAVIWLLIRVAVWIKQKHIDWKRELVRLLMYVNLAVIIRFVFFPRELVDGHIQALVLVAAEALPLRFNLVPLVHLFEYGNTRDIIWNVVGNAAMFVPTGIVLPIVYKRLNRFWKVVCAGAFISLCIEVLQLPFASRASDIDDILRNTLGVVVGYAMYALMKGFVQKVRKRSD